MKTTTLRSFIMPTVLAFGLLLSIAFSSSRLIPTSAAGVKPIPTAAAVAPDKGGDVYRPLAECGTVSFTRTEFATAVNPVSIATADFNGDGKGDLATANFSSGTVSILLNTGTGSFGAPTNFAVGTAPLSIAVGDFNGDGKSDVAVANRNSNNVSILLGTGTGSFGATTNFTVGTSPSSIVVADFNGDGNNDLATANYNSGSVSILLGTGTGSFGAATTFASAAAAISVAVGDFNSDGKSDLAVVNENANNVSILLNTGTGSFSAPTNFAVGNLPQSVAVGDFNRDGKADLAVANRNDAAVSILLGTGTGSFGAATSAMAGPAGPNHVAVGDFNGDGKSDLAVPNRGGSYVPIMLGTGTGSFGAPTFYTVGGSPYSGAIGDFNGDGKSDLATANEDTNNVTVLLNSCIETLTTISGRVTSPSGAGLPSVTVTLSGAGSQAVQTDAAGNYSFTVASGLSYTVLPTSPYFVFTPTRADIPNIALGANLVVNFSVVPQATPTPTPPLQDDFNSTQRDPTKWNLGTLAKPAQAFDSLVSVIQQDGQLSVKPRDGAQGASFNGYVSVKSFDFTGGQVSVEVPKAAGGGAETAFSLGSDAQNNFRFVVMTLGAAPQWVRALLAARPGVWEKLNAQSLVLVFQVKIAGVITQEVIPYDPLQLRYWRFRHDPPQRSVLFETSPDNNAYVERFRKQLEKDVTALAVELTAGTTAPTTGTSNAVFDNLSLISANAQFSTDNLTAGEGDGRMIITVTRSGNVAGSPATLTYRTEDTDTFTVGCFDAAGSKGSAYARCDFATTVGTLSFAVGETQKTFTVPLIDDGFAEGSETFDLRLVNATGAALGAPALIRVTITDNDAAGAPNPVVSSFSFFVRQQYLDFLSREPDTGGFNAWLGLLNSCPNAFNGPNTPSGCDRIFVSGEGFFRSVEFQLKGFYVFRFYKVGLNRLPEYLEVVSDMSYVAGQTAEEVYARKAELATLFSERAEFKAAYGGMTNAQYVAALMNRYQLTQVVTFDPAQPDGNAKVTLTTADLTNRLNANTLTRAQVLRAIADSDAVGAAEFNNAFVGMQYYGYLRRKPDQDGFNAWLRVLQAGNVRTMVDGFLNSVEYKLRFGQP